MRYAALGIGILFSISLYAGAFFFFTELARAMDAAAHASRVEGETASAYARVMRMQRLLREEAEKEVTLLFAGDIMLSRGVARAMRESGDPRFPFLSIATTTQNADITFGNLEGPLSARGNNQGSIYSFRAEPDAVEGLLHAGFDVAALANNHIWDWGVPALSDTYTLLQERGIVAIGAGRNEKEANEPRYIEKKGMVFGFAAYTDLYPESLYAKGEEPGISAYSEEGMIRAVHEMRARADVVIVSIHWGDEYETASNASQRRRARVLIDEGADIVIGHHPHVVQETEAYHGGVIAYSLGNFVFDQAFSEETMRGAMLEVVAREGRIGGYRLIPVALNSRFQPFRAEE